MSIEGGRLNCSAYSALTAHVDALAFELALVVTLAENTGVGGSGGAGGKGQGGRGGTGCDGGTAGCCCSSPRACVMLGTNWASSELPCSALKGGGRWI
jgi:hypothetical protein